MLNLQMKVDQYLHKLINLDDGNNSNKLLSFLEKKFLIYKIKKELKNESKKNSIQLPLAKKINRYASKIIRSLSDYMPNNSGNWTIENPHSISTKLEKQVIEKLKDYFHCQNNNKIVGHFTSGSTEGNIYAAWLGRNHLMNKLELNSIKNMVLLISCLGHYSLRKAGDIINVESEELAINEQSWNIDLDYLEKTILKLYKKGIRGFLLRLTLGYTLTGPDVNIEKICQILSNFKKQHNYMDFFIWIDAAFSGISKMVLEKKFQPLKNRCVQLITTDFHKLLAAPYGSGIVLYRKSLINTIKKEKIAYTNQFDLTLLGSRSGINVIAVWTILKNLNKQKMYRVFYNAIIRKETFLDEIRDNNPEIEILNNPTSTQACLIKNTKTNIKDHDIYFQGYNLLFQNQRKNKNISKLYFFPKI